MPIIYSVIIVNYKTPQLVVQCLQSIFEWSTTSIEIIVVDNNSNDESEKIICSAFPQIRWIQMGYNSGFARANNAGIKASKGNIILLLNSDTLNEKDAIFNCFTRFEKDKYIACGLQLLNADRTPQISGFYIMKGGINYLMALPYIGRLIRRLGMISGIKKPNIPQAKTTEEVDWVKGAFIMVKKSAIMKAGYLDEDFFLYAEESEWCSRLKKEGEICIYGDLNVVHLEGGSSNEAFDSQTRGYQNLSDRKGYQILLSNFVRFRKEFGIFWYLFHLSCNLTTIPLFFLVSTFKTLTFQAGIKKEWEALYGYSRNVVKSLRFFFDILKNQPKFYKVL